MHTRGARVETSGTSLPQACAFVIDLLYDDGREEKAEAMVELAREGVPEQQKCAIAKPLVEDGWA